jgi:predicted Zn finger-like uncharacterized protein
VEVFCPSCRVGYRIPTDKVPRKPRMLMCRNCNHAWRQPFQAHQDEDITRAPNVLLLKNKAKRPSYSNTVLTILREEAALEAKLKN